MKTFPVGAKLFYAHRWIDRWTGGGRWTDRHDEVKYSPDERMSYPIKFCTKTALK